MPMTEHERQLELARKARWRQRKRAAVAAEAGLAVLCPVCDRWFDSWRSQSIHERYAHTPAAS